MPVTKRDVADIALVLIGIKLVWELSQVVSLFARMAMSLLSWSGFEADDLIQLVGFVVILGVLTGIIYLLFVRRSVILDVVFPRSQEKKLELPASLTALATFPFWIRLSGIYAFLTSGTGFLIGLGSGPAMTAEPFPEYSMYNAYINLARALLAILIIWKADWLGEKLGGLGSGGTGGIHRACEDEQ